MSASRHLALLPRDGLFCKDGRGWHTSASGRGHGVEWPWPSTLLGALRTAWGREQERAAGVSFDPQAWRERTAKVSIARTLVLRRPHGKPWTTEHRVWPAPSDAALREGRRAPDRLEPAPPAVPTLGRVDDEARESLWRPSAAAEGKVLPGPRWWSDARFAAWLAGACETEPIERAGYKLERRIQVRVGIRPETMAADEGVLFSHDVVETVERHAEWALGVEVSSDFAPSLATVGSDRRLARIEALPEETFAFSARLADAFRRNGSPGLRVVVASAACFANGWLPDGFERNGHEYRGTLPGVAGELILRAAIVPRPAHVSGWDMAAKDGRGAPKPTSRLVPPGSVYYFERADGRAFDESDARALWLAPLGSRTDEGFGRVVPGVWTPVRNHR